MPRDFGPYELIREIGRGGMGVVYEARQKGLDRSVAVKMILAGHLASPELVRRFQAEAKAAARLRHSNIVHIHDVGQFHGQDFFAMEYIEGHSLAERFGTRRVPSRRHTECAGYGIVDIPPPCGCWPRWPEPWNISTSKGSSTAT